MDQPSVTEIAEGSLEAPPPVTDAVPPASGRLRAGESPSPRWYERAGDRLLAVQASTWITVVVLVACVWFVASVLHPRLILTNTLPTGGDMGAHVWSPVFLRDHLLNHGKLVGWSSDWYAGFPAFQFYMLLPSLLIVILWRSQPFGLVAAIVAACLLIARFRATSPTARRRLTVAALFLLAASVITIGMPYGIAFKIVAVSGLLSLPISAWALGKLSGHAFPGPVIFAVAMLPFLFDRSFNIYGGNIASTMAGEFAFSIGLSLAVLYLGLAIYAVDTGRHLAWAALVLALAGLSHLFPAVWAASVSVLYVAVQPSRARIRRLCIILPVGGLLGAFWALPFFAKRTYLNDMGWGKLTDFKSNLLTRNVLNPANILRDSPPLELVFGLAVVGLVLCIARRNRLGVAIGISAAAIALLFIHLPEGRLWNGRILPFYYLSLYFLAALAVVESIRLLAEKVWARWLAAYALLGLVLAESTRYLVHGTSGAVRVARVLPGPGATVPGVLLVGALATLLAARRRNGRVALVVVAGLVWLASTHVPHDWWLHAHGAHGFFAVAAKSVVHPSIYALLHVLQYPAAYLVIGLIVVEAADLVSDTDWLVAPAGGRALQWSSAPLLFIAVLLVFGPALRSLPGGRVTADGKYRWGLPHFELTTSDVSYLPGWSSWNFSGYENKPPRADSGGYDEFYGLVTMAENIAGEYGCGRSMWEYGPRLEGYGTPMAPMLLPHFTNGCIGSMEGLYFEASSTTPYHFLNQAALSKQPSSAQRDLPYPSFDIDLGIRQLQLEGVRYYLAFSDTAVAAARQQPDLREIASSGPWHAFLVANSDLVQPLQYSPVVYTNVDDHQKDWLQPAAAFFNDPSQYDVLRASHGPAEWPRYTVPDDAKKPRSELNGAPPPLPEAPKVPLPQLKVSGIRSTEDTLEFDVDQVGVPVLVKTSYFPNWKVNGAKGPYRVTPNFMVVIPTSNHVQLHYGMVGVDYLSYALTGIGVVLLALLFRRNPPRHPVADDDPGTGGPHRRADEFDELDDDRFAPSMSASVFADDHLATVSPPLPSPP